MARQLPPEIEPRVKQLRKMIRRTLGREAWSLYSELYSFLSEDRRKIVQKMGKQTEMADQVAAHPAIINDHNEMARLLNGDRGWVAFPIVENRGGNTTSANSTGGSGATAQNEPENEERLNENYTEDSTAPDVIEGTSLGGLEDEQHIADDGDKSLENVGDPGDEGNRSKEDRVDSYDEYHAKDDIENETEDTSEDFAAPMECHKQKKLKLLQDTHQNEPSIDSLPPKFLEAKHRSDILEGAHTDDQSSSEQIGSTLEAQQSKVSVQSMLNGPTDTVRDPVGANDDLTEVGNGEGSNKASSKSCKRKLSENPST